MGIFKSSKTEDDKKATPKKTSTKKAPAPSAKKTMKEMYEGTAVSKTGTGDKKTVVARNKGMAYKVLVKPLITEKAASFGPESKYVFVVSDNSNKIQVADAVNEVYGVKVVSVNIVTVKGKKVRYGKTMGSRKDWKKAIVTLTKGQTINIYEGV